MNTASTMKYTETDMLFLLVLIRENNIIKFVLKLALAFKQSNSTIRCGSNTQNTQQTSQQRRNMLKVD